MRRRPRPTTCSHSSWLPKARTPRTCVTFWASQPSVSIATETTQRTPSPGCPLRPTVATTRRSSSAAARFVLAVEGLGLGLASPPRQALGRADAVVDGLPELEILGVGPAGDVGDGQARDLDDAALDGVHQAEVADQPGEGPALGVAAAL